MEGSDARLAVVAASNGGMRVRSIRHPNESAITNWLSEVTGRWSYDQLRSDPIYRRSWISFDTVEYCPYDGLVHCGLSVLAGASIHWVYDPQTGALTSLGYEAVGDDFDAKIHHGIHFANHKAFFGIQQFHDAPQQHAAPGGKVVAYDFKSRKYDVLGVPVPHNYLISTGFDAGRGILYGIAFPTLQLIRFDVQARTSRILCWSGNNFVRSEPHNPVVDREGNCWSTWSELRVWDFVHPRESAIRFLKYSPATDQITWFDHGTPRQDPTDAGEIDSFICAPDGLLYGGTIRGTLFRLDPRTGQVENLGKPCPENRLAALAPGPDGLVYGAGGNNFWVYLFRFHPGRERIEVLGHIVDSDTGEPCERAHDLTVCADGTVYVGENDTHQRTSRLWVCDVRE